MTTVLSRLLLATLALGSLFLAGCTTTEGVKNPSGVPVTEMRPDERGFVAGTDYDFQEPYLRAIFGFIGITDTTFINAQPLDHPVLGGEALTAAIATEQGLARDPRWAGGAAA